jgi:hypothetical protein
VQSLISPNWVAGGLPQLPYHQGMQILPCLRLALVPA